MNLLQLAPIESIPTFMLAAHPGRAEVPRDTLAGRAQRGDRESLEALLRATAPDILNLCRHSAGPDYEDAAQRALEKIVRKLDRFDATKGTFKNWALAVARNECKDRLRARGREQSRRGTSVETPSTAPGPERIALARLEAADLQQAMAKLPETHRSALALFHGSGLSYEEIANVLDVPKGTVMTWLHRGRKQLRAALTAKEGTA